MIRKDKVVAILGVGNMSTDYAQRDVKIVSYFADVTWSIVNQKRTDEDLRKTTVDLQERDKELSCLYGISRLVETDDLTIDEIIQGIVDLIPQAWQHPETTCAQIKLHNRSYRTKQFTETEWILSREIRVDKEAIGVLEVFLLEYKPEQCEEPFLREEHSLLNAIAERLGRIIERKWTNNELQRAHDVLLERVEERTKELAIQNRTLINEMGERKKAEDELQRSSEQIKLFAYSVAHDLKNPAISTYGLAKILNEKFGDELSDRGKRICEQIQRSTEDIASLVEKINIFISTKETPLKMEKIPLKEVFRILQEEFSSQFTLRSIQWLVSEKIPDGIIADRLSMLRMFRNIIENSLKYGSESLSRIEIDYQQTDDLHLFKVIDDGRGLEKKDNDNIFNWFKRKTTSKEIEGTGMGLAIVKELVALHGGTIWQEPTKPKGVTFYVSLSRILIPIEDAS